MKDSLLRIKFVLRYYLSTINIEPKGSFFMCGGDKGQATLLLITGAPEREQ